MPSEADTPPPPVTLVLSSDHLIIWERWLRSRSRSRFSRVLPWLLVVIAGEILLVAIGHDASLTFGCLLAILGLIVAVSARSEKRKRRAYARRAALMSGVLTADAAGVHVAARMGGDLTWDCFTEVETDDDAILLVIDLGAGLLVPKLAFASPHDAAVFVEYARAHIRNSAWGTVPGG